MSALSNKEKPTQTILPAGRDSNDAEILKYSLERI